MSKQKPEVNSIELPMVEGRTLDNGLKVLTVKDRKLPLVNLVLMIKRGAEADEEGKSGQADLALEMLTLGTQRRSSEEIALEVDSLGARLGFSSAWDCSFIELDGLSEDVCSLLDILSDMVLHPMFPKSEFDQLKERRIASLIQDLDESEIVADIQFVQSIFEGTPYGHPRHGTVDSVRSLSLADLEGFHDRYVVAGRCVLLVVGDIDSEEVFETAEALLGSLKRGSETPSQDVFSKPKRPHRVVRIIHRADLTQSQIRMGHPCIQRTSPDHDFFQVANYILGGGGFSSRLMEKIRSQKGYTYGISSHFKGREQPGPFVISTFTPNENVPAVVREVLEVLDAFVVEGPTSKELEEAKNFYLGSFPFRFETLPKIAREMLEMERYGLGRECLIEYPRRISQMTQAEVQRVVQRRFVPDDLAVVIVGNADSFSESMHTFGAVETVDFRTLVGHQA
jgi:zinc protease